MCNIIVKILYNDFYVFQHTLIVAEPANLIDAPVITGTRPSAPLLYQGTGLVADKENPLVLQILSAHSSAYSYVPDEAIKEVNPSVQIKLGGKREGGSFHVIFFKKKTTTGLLLKPTWF